MNAIKEIREFYGISKVTLHKISGLGTTTIAEYEKGAIPNKSNELLIQAMLNIKAFNVLFVSNKWQLKESVVLKIQTKIDKEIESRKVKALNYENKLMNILNKV